MKIGEQEVAAQRKVIEKAVTKEQLVREFGEEGLTLNPEPGIAWQYDLPKKHGRSKKRDIQKAMEMDRDRGRAEVAAADGMRSVTPHVTIRDGRGDKVSVPEHLAEHMDRKFHEQRRRR